MLAALEAAEAAHRGREAAEAEARRAREETAQARRELAEEAARARADAEAAAARADRQAAESAGIAEMARTERDQAGEQAAAAGRPLATTLARLSAQGRTPAGQLAVLPFPLIFREKKELMGKERNLHDGCDRRGHGVRGLKVELPDGMPGLVTAEATDALGAELGGAGAGLVLDGDGLRRLRAVVMRLQDGDVPGPGR